MEHAEATQLLSEFAAARLTLEQTGAVDAHVAVCEECHEWLEIYQFLAVTLCEGYLPQHHPSSEELCHFALESAGLSPSSRDRCENHVEGCPECAAEVALARQSVCNPIGIVQPIESVARRLQAIGLSRRTLALAATLLLAIGGLLTVNSRFAATSDEYRIAGGPALESQTIRANQLILIEGTRIRGGSEVKLQSHVVAFGNGFSMGSGSALIVSNNELNSKND